ncbi:MAG: hypothetical protein IKV87_02340 [Methanobrevibacter sp.]|nr:hypothetical protein [Methanobrevibacter sp.]
MDLTNIRKAFDELALSKLDEKILKMNGISEDEELITEELNNKREIIEVPFGSIFYSMAIEDEKPVLYIEKASRMGSDNLYIIDENGYGEYDIYEGYPPEIKDRYENHLKNIKETKDRSKEN